MKITSEVLNIALQNTELVTDNNPQYIKNVIHAISHGQSTITVAKIDLILQAYPGTDAEIITAFLEARSHLTDLASQRKQIERACRSIVSLNMQAAPHQPQR